MLFCYLLQNQIIKWIFTRSSYDTFYFILLILCVLNEQINGLSNNIYLFIVIMLFASVSNVSILKKTIITLRNINPYMINLNIRHAFVRF